MSQDGYSHLYTRLIQQEGLNDDLVDASSLLTSTEECSKNICLKLTNSKTVILDNPTKPKYPAKNRYPNVVKRTLSSTNLISFEAVQHLHTRWLEYFRALLRENPSSILPSLAKADFHGAKIQVYKSKLSSSIGISGYLLSESKSRFSIMTESQVVLHVNKIGTVFALLVDDTQYLIYGNQLISSSAGRFTKKLKLRSGGIKNLIGMALNNQDAALYDRQIRLYGLAAQQKILRSKIAIYGEWDLIAQEIAKNLCLNGLGSVHIFSTCTPNNPSRKSGIFGVLGSETQQKISDLNPGVDVKLHCSASFDFMNNFHNLNEYSHIIYSGCDQDDAAIIGQFCRSAHVGFSWVFLRGSSAYLLNDFGEHSYFTKKENNEIGEETAFEESCQFISLKDAMPQLISILNKEQTDKIHLTPSLAAIIGAITSQESIKLVSAEHRPIEGLLKLHGITLEATILRL